MSPKSYAAGLFAAAIMAVAFSVLPADARDKKDKQYVEPKRYSEQSTSLDGRVTGRARTCGYETFQYDSRGIPRGPYCH